ncbi:right-handed parallel beta-helix repeat-containing protein [Desulfobacula phenolica]|uniref:Polymorphic outer membrane protein repeat-containing protein/parallel beta-helix repeat (Two copies) n=1 Tax=Desulfobacula phenolica TaxID=90732 RepID=A0A1H2IER0_9BACT|nr:right-handed parallel beta-helix repeat-containing protein [Desulfobacula phenolica]SDU42640.1 polymorphic outer membrane protein repeat-containing protein/parallel beta-helix repeat (two copies) [Desulfobacula phenolica]
MKKNKWYCLSMVTLLILACASVTFGATLDVPTDYATIQAGIDAAVDGDTVLVADGTYTGEGNKDLDFNGKAITVQSKTDAEYCIIDCENDGRGFYFHSGEDENSVVSGFTITNGYVEYGYYGGGGICCKDSSPSILNCTISNNSVLGYTEWDSAIGGGIYCSGASPSISNCTVRGNSANKYGGGIYCSESSPTISGCTVSDNAADYGGGIYCDDSSPTISDCTVNGNSAFNGGGIYCFESSSIIYGGTVSSNTADYGGGIYYNDSSASISNCTISNNTTHNDWGYGGGIYCADSSLDISDCTISDNSSDEYGGGIWYWNSSSSISNSTVSGNSAGKNGGGICCDYYSSPTISNCTISDNASNSNGGGIYCNDSSPTISGCTVSGNTADGNGGGIYYISFSPNLADCTISNNTAAYGGGIYYSGSGSPNISNCIISGNTAAATYYEGKGGGIYCSGASPTISNCTISDNSVDGFYYEGDGGGICCEWCSSLTISNCIIWNNTFDGIYTDSYSTTIVTYSNIQNSYTGKNNINADPLFAGYGDYHLTTDSPCINAGSNDVADLPDTDLDGNPRISGNNVDMGAYEYADSAPPVTYKPVVDIKANGSDDVLTVASGTSVTITISLDAGSYSNQKADLWIMSMSPRSKLTYTDTVGWQKGVHTYVSEPLSNFTSVTVLDTSLPPGRYRFMIALDGNADGRPNPIWRDSVIVCVQLGSGPPEPYYQ